MMSLLHHNVGYSRLVILLQTDAGFSNGQQFIIQNLQAQEQRNLGFPSTVTYTQHLLTGVVNSRYNFGTELVILENT